MIMKVCGMKYQANIRQLEKVDINWMGIIFHPGSPRYVRHNLTFENKGIKKIGVFVDGDKTFIERKIQKYDLSGIQFHGHESPEYCMQFKHNNLVVIKAFAVDRQFDFAEVKPYTEVVDFFLFDTKASVLGGSGKTFPWRLLEKYDHPTPFLLSGGIGMQQLSDLKEFAHPSWAGIDVNSRFEVRPGLKNIREIKKFRHEFFS